MNCKGGEEVYVTHYSAESLYDLTVTADTPPGYSCELDQDELKKMLAGSDVEWCSTCYKANFYTIDIKLNEPPCMGGYWIAKSLAFFVCNAKKVEVFLDGKKAYSVSC